jgi:hypothetical protein
MEAYVLAAFFRLILMYMRGPKNAVALLENEKPQRLLASPPLCCLRPVSLLSLSFLCECVCRRYLQLGLCSNTVVDCDVTHGIQCASKTVVTKSKLRLLRFGVSPFSFRSLPATLLLPSALILKLLAQIVQLAVVSTITGILAVIFALNDDYVSGDMTFKHNAFPFLSIIHCIAHLFLRLCVQSLTYPSVSLIFGLWALFALYKASHEVLKHFRTTVKFVCIKLVLILLVQS